MLKLFMSKSKEVSEMAKDFIELCIQKMGVPDDIEFEMLSFSERKAIEVCHKLDIGVKVDLDDYATIFDKEKFEALFWLYQLRFNY